MDKEKRNTNLKNKIVFSFQCEIVITVGKCVAAPSSNRMIRVLINGNTNKLLDVMTLYIRLSCDWPVFFLSSLINALIECTVNLIWIVKMKIFPFWIENHTWTSKVCMCVCVCLSVRVNRQNWWEKQERKGRMRSTRSDRFSVFVCILDTLPFKFNQKTLCTHANEIRFNFLSDYFQNKSNDE